MPLYENNKTKEIYDVLDDVILINTTNAQDGEHMIMYADRTEDHIFVRERTEFFEKFTLVEEK